MVTVLCVCCGGGSMDVAWVVMTVLCVCCGDGSMDVALVGWW